MTIEKMINFYFLVYGTQFRSKILFPNSECFLTGQLLKNQVLFRKAEIYFHCSRIFIITVEIYILKNRDLSNGKCFYQSRFYFSRLKLTQWTRPFLQVYFSIYVKIFFKSKLFVFQPLEMRSTRNFLFLLQNV